MTTSGFSSCSWRRLQRCAPLFILLALLAGCAGKTACVTGPPLPFDSWRKVRELEVLPQDPTAYVAAAEARWVAPGAEALEREKQRYLERHFAPWRQIATGLTPEQAFWPVSSYGGKKGYGENLLPRSKEWMDGLVREMRIPEFPSLAQRGVMVRNSALRGMPTPRPFFYDPRDAGEGYPFDYFQSSAIWVGTPVFLSHRTLKGDWVFVEAAFTSGWVPADDVAVIGDADVRRWESAPLTAVLRDDTVASGPGGDFLCSANVGVLLPGDGASPASVLVPARRPDGQAVLLQARVPSDASAAFPLALSPANIAGVARGFSGQPYGWGGMYGNRDCSATTRDIFAPFGLWLPRNSKPQARQGRVVELKDLPSEEKERVLLKQGVPFLTLVGMPGHIMLYIGERDGRALVFHNLWGLRTQDVCGNLGRQIVGRTVVTTLTPGEELEDVRRANRSLRNRLNSLAILAKPKP